MSQLNKASYDAAVASTYADNTNEEITPSDLRTIQTNSSDSFPFKIDVAEISGAWTFTTSPIFPDPTASNHGVTKQYVDLLVSGVLTPLVSVLDRFDPTSATPAAPSTGDRYISTATANGWTDDNIYEWNGASWDETVAASGQTTLVEDENILYLYTGSDWVKQASVVAHNDLNSLDGGTSGEYYHLTSAEYTGLISKSANETISGAYTFSGATTVTGGLSYFNTPVTTAIARDMTSGDNCKLIGVTAASTQTLPDSTTLSVGWQVILDNQINAGGTVTINKFSGDSSGIIKHEGGDVDVPLLETKFTAATIWWDGTNFHIRGRIT